MEPLQQQLLIRFRLSIAWKNQEATVGGGQANIDHLDGHHLFDDRSTGQSRGQAADSLLQSDIEAIGQEGHEDVGLDAGIGLMKNGAQGQVTFEIAEDGFDLGELQVTLPEDGRVLGREIGAQQVMSLVAADSS